MKSKNTILGIVSTLSSTLLTATAASASSLVWEPLAPFFDPRTGGGIEGAAASLIGSKIYVSEGYRPGDTNFLSIYDITTDTWTHGGVTAPDAPLLPRAEGAGGTANGLHYSIGGRPGFTPNGDTVKEFIPGGVWALMDPMLTPRRGLGTGSLTTNDPSVNPGGTVLDLIYAVGGSNGSQPGGGIITGALEVFNPLAPAGTQWTSLPSMPIPLMDVEATIALSAADSGTAAGALYVFGGIDVTGTQVSTTQIYDIASQTWSMGVPMPTARSNGMAGFIHGNIAVFAGVDGFFNNLAVTELYDPLNNSWSAGPNMLFPSSEVAVGVTYHDQCIYSIGEGIFGVAGSSVQRLCKKSVPEPSSTLGFLALGILGAGSTLLRKKKHKSVINQAN